MMLHTRDEALALLRRYNKEPFHIQHALTVEGVMAWYARELGYGDDGADERLIHAVVSHAYGLCSDVAPEHEMEKVLFAADELTGLIGAAALMRPSRSTQDMELSSLKKKFKDKKFAAGCSRDVIRQGAENLGWELDTLLDRTLQAMRACEADISAAMAAE